MTRCNQAAMQFFDWDGETRNDVKANGDFQFRFTFQVVLCIKFLFAQKLIFFSSSAKSLHHGRNSVAPLRRREDVQEESGIHQRNEQAKGWR